MPFTWRNLSLGTACVVCVGPAVLSAAEPDVGVFTAVEGTVSVQHAQSKKAISAKPSDAVLFRDLIETRKESRTKALLNDDSILTVGEHSRVEITEHLYDPARSLRSVVVNLVQGKVRALVGKAFAGSGWKFEIHTPTAVAAARGTYFVVWHMDGASGIANLGTHGNVDFQSGGRTVSVVPGTFSFTPPGGGPPVEPSPMTGDNVPAQVTAAVQGTDMPSVPGSEDPSHTAAASGGTIPASQSALTPGGLSVPTAALSSGSITSPSIPSTTVPAVISGAAPQPTSPAPPPSLPLSQPILPPAPPSVAPSGGHGIGIGPGGTPPGQGGTVPGTGQTNPGQGGSRPR